MKELLNNDDFCRASKKLRCKVAAIKAVANTESAGKGFYSDGFPVILFERHLFKKFTKGKYNQSHPHISGPAGNYGAVGQNQKNKFNEAFELDADAAMKACSWGKFQILGSNHQVCGFDSVGKFVDAMKESEGKQLDAFVDFVIGNHLDDNLRNLDWKGFARGYNGPGYRKNAYDTKMATAYARFSRENIDCQNLPKVTEPSKKQEVPSENKPNVNEPIDDYPDNPKPGEPAPNDTAKAGEPVVGGRPGDEPKEISKVEPQPTSGVGTWIANIRAQIATAGITLASLGSMFSGLVTNPVFIYILCGVIGLSIIAGVLIYLRSMSLKSQEKRARDQQAFELTKLQAEKAADPAKYNIKVV